MAFDQCNQHNPVEWNDCYCLRPGVVFVHGRCESKMTKCHLSAGLGIETERRGDRRPPSSRGPKLPSTSFPIACDSIARDLPGLAVNTFNSQELGKLGWRGAKSIRRRGMRMTESHFCAKTPTEGFSVGWIDWPARRLGRHSGEGVRRYEAWL